MANTIIQIKRSQTTALPTTLQYGELAYSFQSGKLFLGDSSNVAIAIAGNTYNQSIDSATSANTFNTLVKRNASGDFSASAVFASLYGNANTASKWFTPRTFGLDGDASGQATIDGSANANTTVTLKTVNSNVGTWGGVTNIPVFTVNEKGLITAASNVAVSTALSIAGDSGTDSISLLSETLTFVGGDGITSVITENTATFNVDNTVVRTSGNQSISGNLTLTGDLYIGGNTTTVDVNTLIVEDSLIKLANNNTSDAIDIGFYGQANAGAGVKYYGLARVAANSGNYFLFSGLQQDPTGNTIPVSSITQANTGTIIANLQGGIVSKLNSALDATDGGTGLRSYTVGDLIFANTTTALTRLADVATGNVLLSGGVGVAPSYGKVGLTTHVSGVLGISNGGTNSIATPTAGAIVYGNGTSHLFNTAGSSGQALISGGTGAPTFGVLGLTGGGLGFSTITANTVVFANGTNSLGKTNVPNDGNVLQFAAATGVQFGMLDGGSF